MGNLEARSWVDKKILKKEITNENLKVIDLEDENAKVIAYDSKIATVAKNLLTIYDSNGKVVNTIDVEMTSPFFCANGDYFGST